MSHRLACYYVVGAVLAATVAGGIFLVARKRTLAFSKWGLVGGAALSFYMITAQILKYHSLHFYIDFSHWTGLLCNIVNGQGSINPSHEYLALGTSNYLSVHFVPLIYVFAVPFAVFPFSETVLVLNFVLMTSATIPLYKIASKCLVDRRLPLFLVVLLLWYPTFQYIALYEFEMLRFSIPLLFWMLFFWVTRRRGLFFLFACLAMLVREEVGLTVMMFGIYAAIFEKRKAEGLCYRSRAGSLIRHGAQRDQFSHYEEAKVGTVRRRMY